MVKTRKVDQKKKLSERDKRKIINLSSNTMTSCAQIARDIQSNVSRWTIFRVLKHSQNIVRQKLKNVPKLLPRHTAARLEFARNNMRTNWNQVEQLR